MVRVQRWERVGEGKAAEVGQDEMGQPRGLDEELAFIEEAVRATGRF